jgi:UDP-N-acetylglucosamine 2-epimerase (non-hydrolysing)
MNQIFFKDLGIREPDHYLAVTGDTTGQRIGNIIAKSYEVISRERPDAVLILGDTNTTLSAISAKRLNVPIFHLSAGNRCFDDYAPEEINRRIVDHVSDIHLAYTEHSRRNLLNEGIAADRIFVTGSPMAEILHNHMDEIEASDIHKRLELTAGKYFVASAHREDNIDNDKNFRSIMTSLNAVAEHYQIPIVYSTHPRSWQRIEQRGFIFHPLVNQLKPFGFFDYNKLQKDAYCVVSDSSTLAEESAILGFPAVLMRTATARPEVFDTGNMVIGGIKDRDVCNAVELTRAMLESGDKFRIPADFTDVNVSAKVVKIIQSYTKIINKSIWETF